MFSRKKRKEISRSPEERDAKMRKLIKNERSSCRIFSRAIKDIKSGENKKSRSSFRTSPDNSSVLKDKTHDLEVSIEASGIPSIPPPVAPSSYHRVKLCDEKEDSHLHNSNISMKYHSIQSLQPPHFHRSNNITLTEPQSIQPPKPFSQNSRTVLTDSSHERLDSGYDDSLYLTAFTHFSSSSIYTTGPSNFSISSYIRPPVDPYNKSTVDESDTWTSSSSNHTYIPPITCTTTSSSSDFNIENDNNLWKNSSKSECDASDVSADDSFEISIHTSSSNLSTKHGTQICQKYRSKKNNQSKYLSNLKRSTSEKSLKSDTSNNSDYSRSSFTEHDKKHLDYRCSSESSNSFSSPSFNKRNSFSFGRRESFKTPEKRSFGSSDDEKDSAKKHRSSSGSWSTPSRSFYTSTPTTPGTILPYYNAPELMTTHFQTGFIDSHCHLDFLFERTKHSQSFSEYKKKVKEYFPVSFEGCVAVFCNPNTFARKSYWEAIIEEDGIWAAFGCHPHNAKEYCYEFDVALKEALSHNKIVALGEIGLDYSNRNNCDKETQCEVFERQIDIALDRQLPLVIHCREAHDDCLSIMKVNVPSSHKIHLHCFTDTWTVAEQWLEAFPNLYIGLTNLVTYSSAVSVHEVARNIPLERLLLETDTPYFLPRYLPRSLRWSHPGLAIHVAAQVAALKGDVDIEKVLRIVRKNTRNMYGI